VSDFARVSFLPRHWLAMLGVLVVAAVPAFSIWHSPDTYHEDAVVVLTARDSLSIDNPYPTVSQSLVTTSAVMVEDLMSPHSQALVRKEGGTAEFSLALVNYYNQDYPNYSYPFATLTVQSAALPALHRTFTEVLQVLRRRVAQRQADVRPQSRISIAVVGATGPVSQPGSRKRSLATLGLLAAIASGLMYRFLDRHPRLRIRGPGSGPRGHRRFRPVGGS
jgi:hypothetical protein